jgi:hypothetical protein
MDGNKSSVAMEVAVDHQSTRMNVANFSAVIPVHAVAAHIRFMPDRLIMT